MPHRFASALSCVLLLLLVVASGGCEAIVNGRITAFPQTCGGTDLSECPPGEYCKGAGCTACEPRDVCDGFDNDCDGKVDDGPLSDHDGDGYSFCGHVDAESGKLIDVDCVDDDPAIHPGAAEVCNGKDDDCDGIVDNPALVCPANETCVPKSGKSIPSTEACTAANCPPPMICDPSTQKCVKQNGDIGSPCNGDKACTSGVCGDPSMLGAIGGVCTAPCCTSRDCAAAFVCYGAGTGGNYCVKPDAIGRAGVGAGPGGASCGAGTDCRSGLCQASKCVDTCCGDGNCAPGTSCTLATVSGRTTFACVPPPGGTDPNTPCGADSDCRSGVCVTYTDGFSSYKRCAAPCCGSTACGTFNVPGAFGTQIPIPTVCFDDMRGGGTIPLCDEPKQGDGNGGVGQPCARNGDCLSDRCDNNHFCTDVCCVDSDCGRAGWVCRPAQVGSGTYLRCQPVQ